MVFVVRYAAAIGLVSALIIQDGMAVSSELIDFNREIRPILSEFCFRCHGPDRAARQAGLRLDQRQSALAKLESDVAAIVPGNAQNSEVMRRVASADDDVRMPPPEVGKRLTDEQRALLAKWIDQGAIWAEHWAFVRPARPAPPTVARSEWCRNEIDSFIVERLEQRSLSPSVEADKKTLMRRVALDLTGLPPTLDEVDEFLADNSANAYEKVVDRLLASPHFGEHWARMWLDLARYADSAGYADDPPRNIWLFRDYVIDSLNKNKPFDQFTIEQIAGDLLPEPTETERIATAFHRNTLTNNEGGTDDEEFRNVAVVDRVNTTISVWMGLTMACAQCHDHKYDPISQEEYFGLFAFFNNTEDADRPDESPMLEVYTPQQRQQQGEFQKELKRLEQLLQTSTPDLRAAQQEWEQQFIEKGAPPDIAEILRLPPSQRTADQRESVEKHFLATTEKLSAQREQHSAIQRQLAEIKPQTVPVMRELPPAKRRITKLQHRGNFLDVGKEVKAHTPAVFHSLPSHVEPDRMALARWLVAAENPLTARVLANRLWEQVFGTGIVSSSEDFGSQGDLPSHPELLDWLATELVQSHWDIKAFVKLLVMSATYRQSSRVTPEIAERDPDNRLLTRGPRLRLSAEEVRDQALFISGLLSPKIGGPSVHPPQPASGLSAAFGSGVDWQTSTGEDRYRRAIYTAWRRSNPYPSMATFDAPNREVCTVRRGITNTPLQALVTLNDPVYIEAAQALARRMTAEGGSTSAERVRFGFRLCLSRTPTEAETSRLLKLFEDNRTRFENHPDDAKRLATDPLGPPPANSNLSALAAWTVVANTLLNLDEALMKR
jgi:hypothetical protein